MACEEAVHPLQELEKYERLAETAYDAMYEAKSSMAKHHYEDARGHFAKAIDIAKRAGLENEVARLTRRRDHIASVFDHQFRGIGS
jgi:hypothetical protein